MIDPRSSRPFREGFLLGLAFGLLGGAIAILGAMIWDIAR
jgi:hypothetical protein